MTHTYTYTCVWISNYVAYMLVDRYPALWSRSPFWPFEVAVLLDALGYLLPSGSDWISIGSRRGITKTWCNQQWIGYGSKFRAEGSGLAAIPWAPNLGPYMDSSLGKFERAWSLWHSTYTTHKFKTLPLRGRTKTSPGELPGKAWVKWVKIHFFWRLLYKLKPWWSHDEPLYVFALQEVGILEPGLGAFNGRSRDSMGYHKGQTW